MRHVLPVLWFATLAMAGAPAALPASAQTVTEVRVEGVKPEKPKLETVRFLKENRAFLRARLDLLRQLTSERTADAGALDPRFLEYQKMLAAILGNRDSLGSAEDARQRTTQLESITELGKLEAELDLMERLLAEQRDRLGVLEADFTGQQKTALIIVLAGTPPGGAVTEVQVRIEDGTTVTVPLSPERREALAQGGAAQVFHGFVEPREQVFEIALTGAGGSAAGPAYVTLEPARDRLTFLKIDVSGADANGSGTGLRASTWLHDTELLSGNR